MEPTQFQIQEDGHAEPKNILLIVFIVLLAVIVIGGAIFAFVKRGKKTVDSLALPVATDSNTSSTGENIPIIEVTDPSPNDKDRDGILDEEEAELGTSDYDFDTDGDGISDQNEIEKWQTDPLDPDTDGDGFNDGFEILSGYNPLGAGALEEN